VDVFWPDAFEPFSPLHAAVAVAAVLGWWALVVYVRAVRGTPRERRARRGFAIFVWAFNTAWMTRMALPPHFDWGHSLPLHLCDFAWLAAGWSLWSGGDPQRLRHQVPVLWGLALSVLGFITPTLTSGPGGLHFWSFWVTHWQILAVALWNLVGLGTRPDLRGLRGTLLLTAVLFAAATAVNLLLDTSYFFSGRDLPSRPTPLDALGPWPLRIVWMALLGVLALTLVALPFVLARRRRLEGRVPGTDAPARGRE
jgi:hypothetical integral membrane protein (TIGR02206 family)